MSLIVAKKKNKYQITLIAYFAREINLFSIYFVLALLFINTAILKIPWIRE